MEMVIITCDLPWSGPKSTHSGSSRGFRGSRVTCIDRLVPAIKIINK